MRQRTVSFFYNGIGMPPNPTLEELFKLAREHHAAGHLATAEGLYRQILARDAKHAEVLLLQGSVALETGRLSEAVALFRRALGANPSNLGAWLAIGALLHGRGALDPAAEVYHRALESFPDDSEICYRLGHVERGRGKLDTAIEWFRRAILARPRFWEARCNLALALEESGDSAEAVRVLREALKSDADQAQIYHNLGISLTTLGRADEAVAAYRRAIELNPGFVDAYNNLGAIAKIEGRLDDAVAAFGAALRLQPNRALVHGNLAGVYEWQARHDDAVAEHKRAIALAPDDAELHGNYLFTLLFHPACGPQVLREEHAIWNARHAARFRRRAEASASACSRAPRRRLRIGYVCGAFRDHVLGRYLLPVLREHDRSAIEVVCYSNNRGNDEVTLQFQQIADLWRDIAHLSDDEAAALVIEDRIDILIDTTLHMEGNRLLVFARKPAPIQVTFAGYPGSTGLDAMDYRLSDVHLDPSGFDDRYVEKTWRLPDTFWCYDPQGAHVQVGALPMDSSGYVTFGCLNNFSKLNDGVLALWARVLSRVPRSRLLLLAHEGSHRKRTLASLSARGIDPARVEFAGYRPRKDYLALFRKIDVTVDTSPYNGHTTSLDSLWMGVPVVTLVGENVVGRAGLSQLTNLGLEELVGHDSEDYVRIAADLASDPERLAQLRRGLRGRMQRSPLMDMPRFTRAIEEAYVAMSERRCAPSAS